MQKKAKIWLGIISSIAVLIIVGISYNFFYSNRAKEYGILPVESIIKTEDIYNMPEEKYVVAPYYKNRIESYNMAEELIKIRNFETESNYPYGIYFIPDFKDNIIGLASLNIKELDYLVFERETGKDKAKLFYRNSGLKTASEYTYEIDNTFKYGIPINEQGKTKENIKFEYIGVNKTDSDNQTTKEVILNFKDTKTDEIELKFGFDKKLSENTKYAVLILEVPFVKDETTAIRSDKTLRLNEIKEQDGNAILSVYDDGLRTTMCEIRVYNREDFMKIGDIAEKDQKFISFINRNWKGNI